MSIGSIRGACFSNFFVLLCFIWDAFSGLGKYLSPLFFCFFFFLFHHSNSYSEKNTTNLQCDKRKKKNSSFFCFSFVISQKPESIFFFFLIKQLVVNSKKIGGSAAGQTKRIEKNRSLLVSLSTQLTTTTVLQFNTFFHLFVFPALSAQTKDPIFFLKVAK